MFVKEWNRRLEITRQSIKEPSHYQEAELWAGVEEALVLAKHGQYLPEGMTFDRFQLGALNRSPNDQRPSAEIHLGASNQKFPVVVAVSKKDSGNPFGNWFGALDEALGGSVVGAVAVWPKSQLAVGKKASSYLKYKALVDAGTIRPFPLDENESAFVHLDCLRQLMLDAESQNVILGGRPVTAQQCRDLLVETKLLANLDLFKFLFENWPSIERVRAGAVPTRQAGRMSSAEPTEQIRSPVSLREAAMTQESIATPISSTVKLPEPESPLALTTGETWALAMLSKVVEKLGHRGQAVSPAGVELGPTFARLKVEPKDDTDFTKVKKQSDNLKLQLGLSVSPVIAAQAGYISIDVQRPDRQSVSLALALNPPPEGLEAEPAFPVGVDVGGRAHWLNLADSATCHLLIAGTTGSGKSELLKAILAALASRLGPDDVQFILIDPKRVTFNFLGSSPYLLSPVVFDASEALPLVEKCYREMEDRYTLLQSRQLDHIGQLKGTDALSRWIVIFDEFADLMADRGSKKELEALLKRLGAKARAAGIHLLLGTQRAEASIVTPLLRSNLPGRIALKVAGVRDSKLLLDQPDAAYLLGKGDLLWQHGGGLIRLQSPLVTKDELQQILRFH